MPSLRNIEKTVSTLWLRQDVRALLAKDEQNCLTQDNSKETLDPAILAAVDKKGVELYGRCINFGFHDVIDSIYPFCAKLLDTKWHSLIDNYFLRYPPKSYNLNRICCHLSDYLARYEHTLLQTHPYLAELADHEWLELEIMEMDVFVPESIYTNLESPEQLATLCPVMNPSLVIRHYEYPIAEIADAIDNDEKNSFKKFQPSPTTVAMYRLPSSHQMDFFEFDTTDTAIVQQAMDKKTSYAELLKLAFSLTQELLPAQAVTEFLDLIETLQTNNVILNSISIDK